MAGKVRRVLDMGYLLQFGGAYACRTDNPEQIPGNAWEPHPDFRGKVVRLVVEVVNPRRPRRTKP